MTAVELAICGETHDVTDGSSWDVGTCWLPAGHGEDHDYQVERPDIVQRPTPLHAPIDSFASLQAWIDNRLTAIESDLAEKAIGVDKVRELMERRATLLDVAWLIRQAIADEAAEQATVAHAESVEQQYRNAYGPDAGRLAAWQAEGR